MRPGFSFETDEVVDLYLYRPPYPQALFDRLTTLAPKKDHLLDLGCGHGKIARPMARVFDHVTAIDPSQAMIDLGQNLENGKATNLTWHRAMAETAALAGPYDLITAALSIHWMDHDTLFPHLAAYVRPDHVLAIIEGDDAHNPPWDTDRQTFLQRWVPHLTGQPFTRDKSGSFWQKYKGYVDVMNEETIISEPLQQSVSDFILCQHSRDTFAISKLGDDRPRFDAELTEILQPHADADDNLSFRTATTLTTTRIPLD